MMASALRAQHAWTPASLAPFFQFLAWYDTTHTGGAFQDTAKTLLAAPGTPISVLADLSGGGRDAVLVSGQTAPTGATDAYGNLAVKFAGASGFQTAPFPQPSVFGVLLATGAFATGTQASIVAEFGPNANTTNGGAFAAVNNLVTPSTTISGTSLSGLAAGSTSFGCESLETLCLEYASSGQSKWGPAATAVLQENALNVASRNGQSAFLTGYIERVVCGVGQGSQAPTVDLLLHAVTWVNAACHGQEGL